MNLLRFRQAALMVAAPSSPRLPSRRQQEATKSIRNALAHLLGWQALWRLSANFKKCLSLNLGIGKRTLVIDHTDNAARR
jgi:hypothetical protein